jgi:hypothetical protein
VTEIVVADGRLRLHDETGHPAVQAWSPPAHPHVSAPQCTVHIAPHVGAGNAAHAAAILPTRPRDLAWDGVDGWLDAHGLRVIGDGVDGTAHWEAQRASLSIAPHAPDAAVWASLLLIAGPILAARNALLLHAGAIIDAHGGAWLLTGSTHAGKSTTVATWSLGGGAWLADDTVLVTEESNALICHGWVRRPHLDAGYGERRITGRRIVVEASGQVAFSAERWVASAPVRGLLLPRIDAVAPTRVERASAGDALSALLPQSPWLVTLPPVQAAAALSMAARLAATDAWRLRLGADSYGIPSVLGAALASVVVAATDARD